MSFICENPNCTAPDNKKGKVYPASMECPFCDIPLVAFETISESDRMLIEALPYVIAYPLKKAVTESHHWTKINLLKDTFLNYLKYLGLVTASEFFNSPLKDKKMVALFHASLSEPSFGTWNQYIRETLAFLKENNHSFFCPELPKYYEDIESGKKRKLFKGEIEYIDSNGDIQLKKQETTAIGMLINFRNRYLGHGLTLDTHIAKQLWEEYYPIFRHLLEQLRFSKEYPMYKTEHGETFLLESEKLRLIEKQTPVHGNVWMENGTSQTLDIIPFFVVPGEVSIAKEDKEKLLTYESFTGKSIKFFSPEGTEKQTSGKILERLNILLNDKQKEQPYSPETFTKEVFLARVQEENKWIYDTLVAEKKVIPGVYVHRQEMEIKLIEWIGARANIFVLAAEAGSGKTNLLVEIQQQYANRGMPALLIRAGRMEKPTLTNQICYLLNIDSGKKLVEYKAIAGTQGSPTLILIDGLNEAYNADLLWQELFEISKCFEPGSVKFVVSSRANTATEINRFAITTDQKSYLYGDNQDNETLVSVYSHWLTGLSMKETKEAWEFYTKKDKGRFKPMFSFDEIARFDRSLYGQISNPLVLRLFLETYQGKSLPTKGKQTLNIWRDWMDLFAPQEQEFFKLLADSIWEKGENELLLDDVLNDASLSPFFKTDQLNAPYPRLRNLGWVSRYVKDQNACVGFTVEGALFYLLGNKIQHHKPSIDLSQIIQWLNSGTKLQKDGVGSFLQIRALEGDLDQVCELIDAGEELIDACITPVIMHLKIKGVQETLDILLKNPTENDWKILLKVDTNLNKLALEKLRKEMAQTSLARNEFASKASIQLGLENIPLLDREKGEEYLYKIDFNNIDLKNEDSINEILGTLNNKFGEYDKALEYYQQSLEIRIRNFGELHTDVATSYNNLGNIWRNKGDYEKAQEYYQQSLEIRIKILGEQHPDVAKSYNNMGNIWKNKGDYEKALEFYQRSLEIKTKSLGEQHPDVAKSFNNMGIIWKNKGDYDKALEFYQQALEIRINSFGKQHPDVAKSYNNMGDIWKKWGDFDKALEYYQQALEIRINSFGKQHPDVSKSYKNIGNIWRKKVDYKKALDFYQQSLEIRLLILGSSHSDLAEDYLEIGEVQKEMQLFLPAIKAFKQSFEIGKKGGTLFQIAQCYEALSDKSKALEYYVESAEIHKEDPEVGIEHDATMESVKEAIRLAQELHLGEALPSWFQT